MVLTKRTREDDSPQPSAAQSATPIDVPSSDPQRRPVKRARPNVSEEETDQVTTIEEHRLDLEDADVFYFKFVDDEVASAWYDTLLKLPTWYHPKLKVYGREVQQSRKIAAYATDPELVVKYSGHLVELHREYPPLLREIQDLIEDRLGVKFNHCMLNLYEDGNVYIGNHRDNKENRVIASLSLGAPRTFVMTHDSLKNTKQKGLEPDSKLKRRWVLDNGSVVVMQGPTQLKWKHEIPKEPKITQGRISLTFRQLVF